MPSSTNWLLGGVPRLPSPGAQRPRSERSARACSSSMPSTRPLSHGEPRVRMPRPPPASQLRTRSDRNLALIDCGRWLTAEGDSGIANDVDAHGWVLLLEPA
jgi:hypothetical protein